jgi:hypothetical protein
VVRVQSVRCTPRGVFLIASGRASWALMADVVARTAFSRVEVERLFSTAIIFGLPVTGAEPAFNLRAARARDAEDQVQTVSLEQLRQRKIRVAGDL